MFEIKLDIHVEWGHCDPARIVFNPNFFIWMESGMDRLFSVAYRPMAEMVQEDTNYRGVPLLNTQANFQKPAKVGETITLTTQISRWGKTSFDIDYRFTRGDDVLCTATQTRDWCYAEGTGAEETIKPSPIPEACITALSADKQVHIKLVSS